jgi:FkbM family methyltransferase
MEENKTELGGLFYPIKNPKGQDVPFDSLFIPYIYREIYFEGVYLDVLNGKRDMTIVDIGANIGVTVDHFRKFAKKVYAVEPDPMHFKALAKNKEFNNWDNVELFNVAMADKNGTSHLSQNAHNQTCNSITNNYGDEGFEVETVSMDTFFEQNGIEHVDFMKFDPEGAEELILYSDGFKKVASKIDAIECEFHHNDWINIVKYLEELGFKARRYDSSAIIVLFTRI